MCGNSTAFDGVQCQACGYVAPPRPFGDPDTETAKSNDMRKQTLDGELADPSDPNQQLGNQTGDPEELQDQADDAEARGVVPALTCTNCGVGVQPPPAETGGEPPYPAEGDACPVCKSGELAVDSGDQPDEEPEDDTDEDGDGIPDAEETENDKDSDADDGDDSDDDSKDSPFKKKDKDQK